MGSKAKSSDEIGLGRVIVGTVVLMKKKNVLDVTDLGASVLDRVHELLGRKVSFRLVSATNGDPPGTRRSHSDEVKGTGMKRVTCIVRKIVWKLKNLCLSREVGRPAYLEQWVDTVTPLFVGESTFRVIFSCNDDVGLPGAVLVRNEHHSEFYLRTVTLEDVPGYGQVRFFCNSWVYPAKYYKSDHDRIFFSNKAYLPDQTPGPLAKYREEELITLRGDGKEELQEWDRVYDYAYYNDLGNPDKGSKYARPVLGGSAEFPYPRRGRTGRRPTMSDPRSESRIPLLESLKIYVPRDERFSHIKMSDFLAFGAKSIGQFLKPELETLLEGSPKEFDSFRDVLRLYEGGIKLPEGLIERVQKDVPVEIVKEILPTEGEGLLKYPMPQVIEHDKSAWMTDEEFAREMLAGVNPVIIGRLQEFPPKSKLDPTIYGNQSSSITEEHIMNSLDGLSVHKAMTKNKLFILDHHDTVMPHLRQINTTTTKTYATRTILFLNDGTLKPLAIELSLPHPEGDRFGAVSEVYTPADRGIESCVWQLAKAYAAVNDSGHHQLISHWLNTHAVIEPFVIASNRQLSVLHPIYKLLHPHFRDTMNINAFGRQVVINAGGILESTVYPSKYSMELSSAVYKNWIFPEQALPADLIKRGMAVEDKNSPHGLRLTIEDYPYAVDGLEIWATIKTWVEDYCSFYYKSDDIVRDDVELQSWWKELVENGHGDKKDEPWWPEMKTLKDLMETCTIIIWVASALHAALNFGQFPYAGYMPNRPTMSRRFMPKEGTPEYKELRSDPEKTFLKTITAQVQTLLGISLIEILSRHSNDEVYLGQSNTPEWTADIEPLHAFEKFGKRLEEIERKILQMNRDKRWKNRVGPVNVPYMLLFPTSESGMTGKGIPNSVSI